MNFLPIFTITLLFLVAIKRCKKLKVSDKERERWCREVEIVKNIKHPNIISYKVLPVELEISIKSPSNLPLLPMEYCSEGNLRCMLQRPCNSSGLQEADVRTVLECMTEALLYLHQLHIVHRDFKPENVVLQATNERKGGVIYKLIDLGFAKKLDSIVSIVGTTDYVAPEILCGRKYNAGVDYWSFGIVVYEIICGNKKYPFPSNLPLVKWYTITLIFYLLVIAFTFRMKYLQEKKHNHISIYESSTGVNYSSRINQKCHLSSWLKEEIEAWLQKPLELDGSKRCSPNPLHELKLLLKRKILTVFSMYTLEFYYYEINECILISTLKTWIYRDTKIETADQLLLVGKISGLPSDDDLLINVLPEVSNKYSIFFITLLLINTFSSQDDAAVYVFNKYCLWSQIAKLPSPDFLIDNLNVVDKFTALSPMVYCVLNEIKHFSAIASSISLLNEHSKLLFREIFTQHERLYLMFYKMATLIEFCNSIRKQITTKNCFDKETGLNLMYLISCMKNISTKMDKLETRVVKLKRCEQIINEKNKNFNAVLTHHSAELEYVC